MAWRVHLSKQAIRALHIMPGQAGQLAVWTRADTVYYYDLMTGVQLSRQQISPMPDSDRGGKAWQDFIDSLKSPDSGIFLPFVSASGISIYNSHDGKMRLYHTGAAELYLEKLTQEIRLPIEDAGEFRSIDLERSSGTTAALDEKSQLHLFQHDVRIGRFDVGLKVRARRRPAVIAVPGGVLATDGRRLVRTNIGGSVVTALDVHYSIGRIACSPDGRTLVTSDMEAGVLRVYDAHSLQVTHQRFAIDLIASAQQVQLLADLPPAGVALSALSVASNSWLAFAMAGVICAADVAEMHKVPRPRSLV